jgi:Tfp pilus assembly protein PilF
MIFMNVRHFGAAMLLFGLAACASGGSPTTTASNTDVVAGKVPVSAYLAAADASREDGRYSEALQIYQQVLVSDPKSSGAQFGVAECLLGLGKAEDARPMFEALAQDKSLHAVALQGKGLAHLALGQHEPAAKALRAATEADPSLWRAWNGLGLLADLKHEPHEAEDAYGTALAINPDSAALHNNLGYSHLLAGHADAAMTEFRKANGLDPKSETVQNNYRLALAAKGNYAEAMRGVSKAMLPTTLNNVGVVAMQRGDLATAEGYFARAMESSPSFATVTSKNIEQLTALKNEGVDTSGSPERGFSARKLDAPVKP